jgi:uncharacterized protein (TIGR02145 family)
MADWAATAESNGQMAMIRRNLENLGYAEEIASFENVVEEFATGAASSESSSSAALGSGTSSSSVIASEVKQSSSSSSVILSSSEESCNNTKDSYLNPEIEYGEMIDSRDGQVYKTVKIGNQVWMAENLNYADSVKTPSLKGRSWCYKNDPENCKITGRFYTWTAAIDSVKLATDDENPQDCGYGKKCSFTSTVQGACPDGWHLPNEAEWNALFVEVGGKSIAGKVLKSQVGWGSDNESTNEVGFSAIAAGFRRADGAFLTAEAQAHFWTIPNEDSDEFQVIEMNMYSEFDNAFWNYNYKNSGFNIRCMKDDGETYGLDWSVPKKAYLNPDINYGEMTDGRDGKVYKTVKIGDLTWMAENLNYADSAETPSLKGKNWCFDNNPKKCEIAGRLYSWAAAIDSVKLATDESNPQDCGRSKTCLLPTRVRGICPEGWHLPDTSEWRNLQAAVGWQSEALMSSIGWTMNGSGTDDVGFSALPAGEWDYSYGFGVHDGNYTYFLSAQENGVPYVYVMELTSLGASLLSAEDRSKLSPCVLANKSDGHSIRCVKD